MNLLKPLGFLAAGLVLGTLITFAGEHYLGEGAELVQAQADLAAANDNLTKIKADSAKLKEDNQNLKTITDSQSAQVQQLETKNSDLNDRLKNVAAPSPALSVTSPFNSGLMKAAASQQAQEKLLLYKTRLNLTPDQEAAVKAALDNEGKRAEQMLAKMSSGEKMDPAALAASAQGTKSVDQTLKDILTPDQLTAYQQMQADQKSSAQESMATMEMNQIAPLLQLNDQQKDQVYSALYQVQANAQDPAWIKAHPTNLTDPTAILDAQAKAKEEALAQILTPAQMTTYRQQAQTQLQMQKAMLQKFMPVTTQAQPQAQ